MLEARAATPAIHSQHSEAPTREAEEAMTPTAPCEVCGKPIELPCGMISSAFMCGECMGSALRWAAKQAIKEQTDTPIIAEDK